MTTTDHANCLHPATKAGRTACRKAGGPRGYAYKVQADAIASGEALCRDCFWGATTSALENLTEQLQEEMHLTFDELDALLKSDLLFDSIFTARAYRSARGYLFDEGCLSACTAHEHLI